ncbi:Bidirectional sugar transporter SWEET [Psidium guajava]|nr:Bidirectional sugar transporter SWEET [Psidium guajava]
MDKNESDVHDVTVASERIRRSSLIESELVTALFFTFRPLYKPQKFPHLPLHSLSRTSPSFSTILELEAALHLGGASRCFRKQPAREEKEEMDVPHFLFGIFGGFSFFLAKGLPLFRVEFVKEKVQPNSNFFLGTRASLGSWACAIHKLMNFIFLWFCSFTGNATALFLFLSPMITFKRVIKRKSTEEFSGIPYVMTLLNCLLSAWYGLPFVSPNNLLVSTINGTGAAIESVYVVIFLIFAPRKEKAKILGLLTFVLGVFAIIAFVSLFALHGHARKLFCGVAATVFSIIMYGSPLSIMRLVIKTKSVEFMPFFLSLFVFLCGTSWFIYGLLGRDPFVAVPNGFGCGLGTVQLILYAIYRNSKGEPMKKVNTDGSMEMTGEAEKAADRDPAKHQFSLMNKQADEQV